MWLLSLLLLLFLSAGVLVLSNVVLVLPVFCTSSTCGTLQILKFVVRVALLLVPHVGLFFPSSEYCLNLYSVEPSTVQ
jgi:hypothetical protein